MSFSFPAMSTNQFLNNRGKKVGALASKTGKGAALSSMSGRLTTAERLGVKSGKDYINTAGSDKLNANIKQRQQVRLQQKRQEELQNRLKESERLRLEQQTNYTDSLVSLTDRQAKQNAQYDKDIASRYGSQYSGALTNNDARNTVVNSAFSMIGTPYAWGGGGYKNAGSRGTGKGTQNVVGVDCSGLTSYAYGQLGIKIPRHSRDQLRNGVRTSLKNAKPGDLIGWSSGSGIVGHVGIYIGNGKMIHSPQPGSRVKVSNVYNTGNAFAVSYF